MSDAKNISEQFNFLQDDGLGGFEGMTQETIAIPFLRILQQLSPQIDDTRSEYIEGAKKGMFCCSTIGKVYAPPLEVVVGKFERYFTEWRPDRGGFAGAHSPEIISKELAEGRLIRDEKNQLVDISSRNIFVDTYVYYIVLPQHMEDGLMILSLTSTQLKTARAWNRQLMSMYIPGTQQRAKPWYTRWSLTTPTMSNDRGTWSGLKVDFAGWINQEQLALVQSERAALPQGAKPDLALLGSSSQDDMQGVVIDPQYSQGVADDVPF